LTAVLLLLSPAKKLHSQPEIPAGLRTTQPGFADQAELLITQLRKYSAPKLADFMKLSPALAAENVQRYKDWQPQHRRPQAAPSVLTFAGEVYFELKAATLTTDDLKFAQQHLRILSGLYGVLRPLDLIHPYRMEMGRNLKNPRGKNLYEFWGDHIRRTVEKQMKAQGDDVILNLASKEYFKAVQPKELQARVIHPQFKEARDGGYKMIGVFAKKARGMMTRWVIQNRITDPSAAKKFRVGGYGFNAAESVGDQWVFTRGDQS
jgi:uncharacterized protein